VSDAPKLEDEQVDAAAILRRRDFLVKSAAGLVAATALGACEESQVCLSIAIPQDADAGDADASGDADSGAQPEVCLSPLPPDATDTDGA